MAQLSRFAAFALLPSLIAAGQAIAQAPAADPVPPAAVTPGPEHRPAPVGGESKPASLTAPQADAAPPSPQPVPVQPVPAGPAAAPAPASPAPSPAAASPAPAPAPAASPAPAAGAPPAAAPANPVLAPAAAAPQPVETGTPATVLDTGEADGIIGRSVRSAAGEDMGRIVDVIVSGNSQVRAVVIDFGGFLGVGSRKIAVDWRALHFATDGKQGRVTLALTRNQVRVSPEFKTGESIVILGLPPTPAPGAPAPAPSAAAPSAPAAPAPAAPAEPAAPKTAAP